MSHYDWGTYREESSSYKRKPKRRSLWPRPIYKKLAPDVALQKVRSLILFMRHEGWTRTSAEYLAKRLGIRKGPVTTALMQLNKEGLVGHKVRAFAHDTSRNPWFYGDAAGWAPNFYPIYPEKQT